MRPECLWFAVTGGFLLYSDTKVPTFFPPTTGCNFPTGAAGAGWFLNFAASIPGGDGIDCCVPRLANESSVFLTSE